MTARLSRTNYLPGYNDPDQELFNANRHRENLEYALELERANLEQIHHVLYDGFRHQLQNQIEVRKELQRTRQTFEIGVTRINAALKDVNSTVQNGFEHVAAGIARQIELHVQSYGVLQEILGTLQNPRAAEAGEWARLAADNMRQALQMTNESRSKRLLDEAVELLEKALQIHDFDAKAHFDYAWLCRNYLKRPEEAKRHFDTAALRAMGHEKQFAVFALRNLASVCHDLGEHDAALEAITEAQGLLESPHSQLQLECARALLACGRVDDCTEMLRSEISKEPIQYELIVGMTDLSSADPVASLLNDLFEAAQEAGHTRIESAVAEFHRVCDFAERELTSDFEAQANRTFKESASLPYQDLGPFFDSTEKTLHERMMQVVQEHHRRQELAYKKKQEEKRKADQAQLRRERDLQKQEELRQQKKTRQIKFTFICLMFVSVCAIAVWVVFAVRAQYEQQRIANTKKAEADREVAAERLENLRIVAARREEAERTDAAERLDAECQQIRRDLYDVQPAAFVAIPAGQFLMGEKRKAEVTISRGFSMSVNEITVGQVLQWLNDPETETKGDWIDFDSRHCPVRRVTIDDLLKDGIKYALTRGECQFGQSVDQPMVEISWHGATAFANWFTQIKNNDQTYRLPTEAEWEYAYRAGTSSSYYWGDDPVKIDDYAWHAFNSDDHTQIVGKKLANAWGLYDMAGNVSEWADVSTSSGALPEGSGKSNRGGSWLSSNLQGLNAWYRSWSSPSRCYHSLGFRLVAQNKSQ